MNLNQNKSESSNSSSKNRSKSIPKAPSIPPPPIPGSSPISLASGDGAVQNVSRIRAASESVIPSKSTRLASPAMDNRTDSDLTTARRSVSFSRSRNSRSRTSTGKGILKKSKFEDTDNEDQRITGSVDGTMTNLILDARNRSESRGRKSSRSKKKSLKVKSTGSLPNDDQRGRSDRKDAPDSSSKAPIQLPIPTSASPAVKDGENIERKNTNSKGTDANQSIFSNIGKKEADFVDHILKVHVHKADELITDVNIRNPIVRVSLIDITTGHYLSKSKMDRKVTSATESEFLNVILPCLTQIYSFKPHQSNEPKWEEELIFNEEYLHILQPNIIIGFEILNLIKSKRTLSKETDGWNKIAWGFIKVISKNKKVNTEQKIRLQLFRYPRIFPWTKKPVGISDLYHAYKSARVKYPSTLYVTISGVPKMEIVQVKSRPRFPTEVETGRMTFSQMVKSQTNKKMGLSRSFVNLNSTESHWRYKAGQSFKLPNKLLYGIDCGIRGAFSCSFSNNGYYLALACVGSNAYPIKVYDIINGERVATLEGHQDLVYQLTWSSDDAELLSASSDSTVRVWNFDENGSVFNVGIISQPSFVYTAVYHPLFSDERKVVVTAGHDGLIRAWGYDSATQFNPRCLKSIPGHKNYINCLIFDEDGRKLYSADSIGYIKVWDTSLSEDQLPIFKCTTTVDIFYGIPICHLSIHYASRKILIQTSSNTLHILDSRILKVLHHIDPVPKPFLKRNLVASALPALPNPIHSLFRRSQFSPCGNFILSGTTIYETDSGKKVALYDAHGSVVDVAWHPNDFICCLVEYGGCRTNIYTYDSSFKPLNCPQPEVVNTTKNSSESLLDRKVPLKTAVSDTFRQALTQLKLGEDLLNVTKMPKYEGIS